MWIIAVAALVVAAYAVSQIPKPQSQPPAGFGDLQVPTAEVGREIPVLFGTKEIKSANVVWYGDFSSQAIRKKGGKK